MNTIRSLLFLLVALLVLSLLSACAPANITAPPVSSKTKNPVSTFTPTSSLTPSISPSPTPTPTFTPTPTPTPTALPAEISGAPRGWTLLDPVPGGGAVCGLVDTLDFPLDPPHGEDARGGGDFGRFRSRYNKFHAGEDWRFSSGDNFGKPVYAIGHGQITYADGDGWGPDKGVVIIRHIFPDGSTFLSFYGHLDPPSVTLKPGDCVWRGDKVGEIGHPRTPPHLHFEIRLHLPISTGGGYWSTDPAGAGWLPPSQTIWEYRMSVSPGVSWTRGYRSDRVRPLGQQDETLFVISSRENIQGIDLSSGETVWSQPLASTTADLLLEQETGLLYTVEFNGRVSAFNLAELLDDGLNNRDEFSIQSLWQIELGVSARRTLLPRPRGGLLVSSASTLTAISPDGEILWQSDDLPAISNWVVIDNQLIFSAVRPDPSLWVVGDLGPEKWDLPHSGIPVISRDQLYLYAGDGIYTLDMEAQTGFALLPLPETSLNFRGVTALPNGDLLIFHQDRYDHRLLLLHPDGSLGWERSIKAEIPGEIHLITLGDQAYLLSQSTATKGLDLSIYHIDPESAVLSLIFQGGTRTPVLMDTWAAPVGDGLLLINVGGGSMVLLDPLAALETVSQ